MNDLVKYVLKIADEKTFNGKEVKELKSKLSATNQVGDKKLDEYKKDLYLEEFEGLKTIIESVSNNVAHLPWDHDSLPVYCREQMKVVQELLNIKRDPITHPYGDLD